MNLSKRQYNFIRIGVEMLVILVATAIVALLIQRSNYLSTVHVYDEGWTVIQDDRIHRNVQLSQYEFAHILNKGDTLLLQNILPRDIEERSSLSLLVYLSTVDVYVENTKIYSYGHDINDRGKMVGSGYHFIHLPEHAGGKRLTIVVTSCEDAAFSSIPAVTIMKSQSLLSSFAREHAMVLFISIFLTSLGCMLLIVSAFGAVMQNRYRKLIWVGSFSALMGCWSLCNTKTMQIFSMNLAMNTELEYMSLFLAVIPLVLQMFYMRQDSKQWKKVLLAISVVLSISYAIVAIFLHVTDIAHFCKTLSMFHTILVFDLVAVIAAVIKPVRDMNASDRVLNLGFLSMFITGAIDLVRFVVQKYFLTNNQDLSNSVLPVGTLVFIVLLLMSYLFFTYNNIIEEENRKTLTRLAYHDNLTGLYNRTKCEKLFSELDKKDEDYVIVNMDLNGLKRINDTHGHNQGDLLLKTFAENMQKAFSDETVSLIRMGGDEFLIIGKEKDRTAIRNGLKKLEALNEASSRQMPFEVRSAYGMAGSTDLPSGTAEKIYRMADERMYEMKMTMKKAGQHV